MDTSHPKEEADPALLQILVCPVTKQPLTYDREAQELISKAAGLAYPIRKGIPIMLPEEARKLTDEPARHLIPKGVD